MPKVSIIIPTFNRANIVTNTIDSILLQTMQHFEIIVVSNGSTDHTEAVIKNYLDPRIKYIFQQGTGSPASPRNNGIKHAIGEYIAFCDDDDLWEKTKLEKQLNLLADNPDCGLCYTKMKRFDHSKEWVNPNEEYIHPNKIKNILYYYNVPLSSVIIKKEILQQVGGFDESKAIAGAEDYEFMLRAFKHTNFCCVPEYLLYYFSGEHRLTNVNSNSVFFRCIKYLLRIIAVYRSVIRKGYYRDYAMIMPTFYRAFVVIKIIAYDIKVRIFSRV